MRMEDGFGKESYTGAGSGWSRHGNLCAPSPKSWFLKNLYTDPRKRKQRRSMKGGGGAGPRGGGSAYEKGVIDTGKIQTNDHETPWTTHLFRHSRAQRRGGAGLGKGRESNSANHLGESPCVTKGAIKGLPIIFRSMKCSRHAYTLKSLTLSRRWREGASFRQARREKEGTKFRGGLFVKDGVPART